jgi:hypothetical protein
VLVGPAVVERLVESLTASLVKGPLELERILGRWAAEVPLTLWLPFFVSN